MSLQALHYIRLLYIWLGNITYIDLIYYITLHYIALVYLCVCAKEEVWRRGP